MVSPQYYFTNKLFFKQGYLYFFTTLFWLSAAFHPVAQKYTSAEKAGLFTALNPLIAAILGVIFLNETFTHIQSVGAICILLGITIVQLPLKYLCKTHRS